MQIMGNKRISLQSLLHQHGCCFIVLEHQYGRHDVMWKRAITQYYQLLYFNNTINIMSNF